MGRLKLLPNKATVCFYLFLITNTTIKMKSISAVKVILISINCAKYIALSFKKLLSVEGKAGQET